MNTLILILVIYYEIQPSFSVPYSLKNSYYFGTKSRINNLSQLCLLNKNLNLCAKFSPDGSNMPNALKGTLRNSQRFLNVHTSSVLRHPLLKLNDLKLKVSIPRVSTASSTTRPAMQSSKLNDAHISDEVHAKSSSYYYERDYNVTASSYSTMPNNIKHTLGLVLSPTQYENDHNIYKEIEKPENPSLSFAMSLERFENLFYQTTFNKLISISPPDRKENGISFLQTGLFLYLTLMAISTEVNFAAKVEIEACLGIETNNTEKIKMLKHFMSWVPVSSSNVKFRWSSRLVLSPGLRVSQQFVDGTAKAMNIHLDRFNGSESSELLANFLNSMVTRDSGGGLRNTFEENDLADGICSVLLTTVYIRAQWRSAPTVLNDTRTFYDCEQAKERTVRMIRINDIMRYTALDEWNAEAVEINYATPGLTLLLLVPRSDSLKNLVSKMTLNSLQDILNRMRTIRVAVTLPLYTLRMTLLLPGKLKTMGMTHLVATNLNGTCDELKLTHAVQRLMFWSEAGRNAYKDDGIEWDAAPDLEVLVNRPYIFFVRWHNVILMNGNFVL